MSFQRAASTGVSQLRKLAVLEQVGFGTGGESLDFVLVVGGDEGV